MWRTIKVVRRSVSIRVIRVGVMEARYIVRLVFVRVRQRERVMSSQENSICAGGLV